MPAYCLFNVAKITNEDGMNRYREKVFEVVKKYQGEYLVIGGPTEIKEGEPKIDTPVLIRFPTLEMANAWYHSPEYADLLALRKKSGQFDAVFFNGVPPS